MFRRTVLAFAATLVTAASPGCSGGGSSTCTPGAVEACYSGPAGTEGVGLCRAGEATCLDDGSGFGPCVGEVLPTTESCGDGDDDDCDGYDNESDIDGDGVSGCDGDCCETTLACPEPLLIGTRAIELPTDPGGTPFDDDCDGTIDEAPSACDTGLAIDDGDPANAAKAMDLCHVAADASDWGVVSASYVRADGTASVSSLQNGLLANFGTYVSPQAGAAMVGLSSGNARDADDDPDPCGSESCGGVAPATPPAGYPQNDVSCASATSIYNDAALQITLRAPLNVTGFTFDFAFFSHEFAQGICTAFNDQLAVIMSPAPAGAPAGNIATGNAGELVTLHHLDPASWQVCDALAGVGSCPLGMSALVGTGFDVWHGMPANDDTYAGATGWLEASAPVAGGDEFTLRFAVWDASDPLNDTTVLIDNFRWVTDDGREVSFP